ncbi:MAG: SRPBCC family protein [Bdellovibrionaceae bacterium]|nr:SRPBCC family protein [Pseudobdellovibrionaceae bacterium]MDW8190389.1 SRPBCC family protein [Pseudobdellovibrionaceae bacterium]
MAQVVHTEVFNCSPETFFKIVTDYEKYPEFLSDVKKIRILKNEGDRKLVEYTISVIKTFVYQLWMTEKPFKEVSWELAGGDLFKKSEGYWKLESLEGGKKTRATYGVDVEFNFLVPKPIAKALVNSNLPSMMESYHKRITRYV